MMRFFNLIKRSLRPPRFKPLEPHAPSSPDGAGGLVSKHRDSVTSLVYGRKKTSPVFSWHTTMKYIKGRPAV